MKSILTTAVLGTSFLLTSQAFSTEFDLGVRAGHSNLELTAGELKLDGQTMLSDADTEYENAPVVAIEAGLESQSFRLGTSLSYSNYHLGTEEQMSFTAINANGRFYIPVASQTVQPYTGLAVGIQRLDFEIDSSDGESLEFDPAYHYTLGVSLGLKLSVDQNIAFTIDAAQKRSLAAANFSGKVGESTVEITDVETKTNELSLGVNFKI